MFANPVLWIGIGIGFFMALVVVALVVPDKWAIWLATRKNLPTWLMPFGVLGLLLGLGNLLYALGAAVVEALANTKVAPWVWYVTLAGLIVVVMFFVVHRLRGRKI